MIILTLCSVNHSDMFLFSALCNSELMLLQLMMWSLFMWKMT